MSEITIKSKTKEITAWTKEIAFEREGETHLVTLYWDINDGYDLVFKNKGNQTPEWAAHSHALLGLLDSLTEGKGE